MPRIGRSSGGGSATGNGNIFGPLYYIDFGPPDLSAPSFKHHRRGRRCFRQNGHQGEAPRSERKPPPFDDSRRSCKTNLFAALSLIIINPWRFPQLSLWATIVRCSAALSRDGQEASEVILSLSMNRSGGCTRIVPPAIRAVTAQRAVPTTFGSTFRDARRLPRHN
jgi:hypothetical protein